MNNNNFQKLLKKYKKYKRKLLVESSGQLLQTIIKDAVGTVDLWITRDLDDWHSSNTKDQYDILNDSIDNYLEDVYDDIEDELDGESVDKWIKKYKKTIIKGIQKELLKR